MHTADGRVVEVRGLAIRTIGRREPILRHADLEVDAGETVAIVGRSGSGKSSLLRSIVGLGPISGGTVRVLGVDVGTASGARTAVIRRDGIGLMFQDGNLIDSLPTLHNVALPMQLAGRRDWRRGAETALAEVELSGRERDRPTTLSGGERQRVAVARIIAARPALVVADEPTASLDPRSSRIVMAAIRRLATSGSGVLVVTHDLAEAARADRVVVIAEGIAHTHTAPSESELRNCLASTSGCRSEPVP